MVQSSPTVSSCRSNRSKIRLRVGSARAVSRSRILGAAIVSVYPDGMVVDSEVGVKGGLVGSRAKRGGRERGAPRRAVGSIGGFAPSRGERLQRENFKRRTPLTR